MRLRDRNWCAVGAASTQVRPADACGASGAAVLGALDYLTYVSGKLKEEPVVAAILGPMNRALPLAIASLLTTSLSAHHGAGTFDRDKNIELAGTITGVDFVNPHSWVYFDVVGADGAAQALSLRDACRDRAPPLGMDARDVPRRRERHDHRPRRSLRRELVLFDDDCFCRRHDEPTGTVNSTKRRRLSRPTGRCACRAASPTSRAIGLPSSSS